MNILGIQKDHNSSACLFVDNELVYYNQEERLSKFKKDTGLPIRTLQEILKIESTIDVLIISGYDSIFTENLSIINIIEKLGFTRGIDFKFEPYYHSHHLSHAATAFYNSKFDNALVFISDGKGATYNLDNGDQAQETTSIFTASYPDQFGLVYRRFFTHSKDYQNASVVWDNAFTVDKKRPPRYLRKKSIIEIRNDYDLGFMYEGTSRSMELDDEGGKLMSLQTFGVKDNSLPPVLTEDGKFNMDIFKFDEFNRHRGFDIGKYPSFTYQEQKINFSSQIQATFQNIGLNLIKDMLDKTGEKNLILSGGTALNVVANSFYRKNLPSDINLYIEPMCGDEGNCIGLCQYYIQTETKATEIKKPLSIYLGGHRPQYEYSLKENEFEIKDADEILITDLIRAGHVVALYQGRAEAGPRALGNRSFLYDPRVVNGKDVVNKLKYREPFRPFGAVVMQEHASDWFELDKIKESPFMMYAVDIKDQKFNLIPAVTHVDNTCRIQTVTREQNQHLHNLLKTFNDETGVPMLLNTSFNLAGKAIVETLDDAISALRESSFEYLYLPEIKTVLYIKN